MKKSWGIGFLGVAVLVMLAGGAIAMASSGKDGEVINPLDQATVLQEAGKPWLGITASQTSDGLTVASVIADSPADSAGLQRGDVITATNGTTVSNLRELREQLKDKVAGDTVSLTIDRDGQTMDVSVTLGEPLEPLRERHNPFPELDGIEKGELFEHVLSGQFNLTDENGNPITVNVIAGTLASKTDDSVTITPNDGSGDKTYQITEDTVGQALLDRLEDGAKVVVATVGSGTDARVIAPVGLIGSLLPGISGQGFNLGDLKDRIHGFMEKGDNGPMQ